MLARLAVVPAFLVATWMFLQPPSGEPERVDDKFAHAVVFVVLTALILLAGVPVAWTVVMLLAYAVGIEITQWLMPYDRTPEVLDVVADATGMAIVLAAWILLRPRAGVARRG